MLLPPKISLFVIPAKAGAKQRPKGRFIHRLQLIDSRLRGNDDEGYAYAR